MGYLQAFTYCLKNNYRYIYYIKFYLKTFGTVSKIRASNYFNEAINIVQLFLFDKVIFVEVTDPKNFNSALSLQVRKTQNIFRLTLSFKFGLSARISDCVYNVVLSGSLNSTFFGTYVWLQNLSA